MGTALDYNFLYQYEQRNPNMCWNLINSLPPPHRGPEEEQQQRKRVEAELHHQQREAAAAAAHQQQREAAAAAAHQQQAVAAVRQQQLIAASRAMSERERAAYYPPPSAQVQRPPSVPSKVDYGPPPAAHSRVSQGGKGVGQGEKPQLPKAEPPNFNLFGYHPSYQSPLAFLPQHQQADSKHMKQDHKPTQLIVTKSSSIDNPPPLLSDMKNSVIVKNEGKSPQSMDSVKPLMAHSPSPKPQGHYLATPVSSSPSSAAQMKYEYRSPSQSPHHLSHPHTPSPHPYEMNKVVGHHPRQARQSPHPPPHRQSPHPPPASQPPHHRQSPHQHQPHPPPPPSHRQSPHHPHPHPSPPSTVVYTNKPSATVLSYPYPAPGPPGIQHYAPPPASPALLKPKVSSPAPPHIYGKPGIASGTPPVVRTQDVTLSPLPLPAKPPLATSPYQQLSQHNPPPPHQVHPSAGLPPPPAAHSARVMYDQRGGATTVYPVAVSVKAPAASPPDHPHLALTPAVQTQPLDLGVSSSSVRLGSPGGGLSLSPKRKVCDEPEALDIKKRRSETPTSAPSDTISANASCVSEPVLSRVSEPSPLLANAATTITTVVNVAAAAAAAATESVDNVGKPGTPAPCPSPAKPGSGVDSEKSNSPGPPRPVHKLKKAWLQRHSGEDVTSCVAPPSSPPASRKESPVISSLHSIGSMAVNSISKSSKPAKGARKGKDDASLHNGHLTPVKTTDADDSSSSDLERKTTPVKRVPPKVKRKKGGRSKAVAPASKKPQQTAVSASSTDSDKESGSEKDSDGKKTSAASNDKPAKDSASANGRKRGRRPKSSNNSSPNQTKNEGGEEPRGKKPREDPPAPPFQKQPTVAQLKKSGDSFLQDGPCFEVAPKLAKCRECRWTPNQRSRNMPNIFCRFYAFRRLRYTKNGQLAIAGFSDPHRDASHDDLKLWLPPPPDNPSPVPDLDMSRFLLSQLGDPFCHIIQQENEALSVHMSEDKVIAWKRVVQGVREMCDVCETTLFNYHWACSKCGFVVCIDCYKGRKNGTVKEWNDGSGVSGGSGVGGGGGGGGGRDRDEVSWLLCTNRQPHEQDKLMLTQIVAGDSLQIVSRKAHEACLHLGISMNCACPHAQRLQAHVKPTNGINKDLLKNLRTKAEPVNGQIKQEKPEKDEESVEDNGGDNKKTDPLNWLADLALSSEDKKHGDTGSSDSDTEDGNHSTLRELLIRAPSTKGGHATPEENSSSSSPAPAAAAENGTTLPNSNVNANAKDELTWKKKKEISNETDSKAEVKTEKLVHYVSRYTGASKGGSMSLPLRIMTLSESSLFYPDVPHLWLCDGKLLRLLDADNPDNYSIFQDQWKRGQPVMVSDVTKNMDMSLWHPDAFAKDFGDDKNHLVNCLTGKIVPNQPMRKFWEGFDSLAKRLKDEKGQPMVLKLKDWPPTEDFAEMLPTRFNDLMKVLPLKEYTTRGGRLNLASRLPECFVRPDLGPKMYTAYGSAGQHKGTTNLHLDISDAVNVMIYVSIPEDACEEDYNKEALRAIDEASCDILTRRRVREAGILPGAIWHIYLPRDADKIRDFLNKVALERGARLEPHHDPIHDQTWYIDTELQVRLYQEYNVQGFSIVQCQGDAVFIPAGAPHQVKNLHNCIKVAEDFVSPENVSHCFHLTQEFRELSDTHSNHEDKLQIKNIMYHAVKDSLGVLSTLKTEPSANDAKAQPQPQVTDES